MEVWCHVKLRDMMTRDVRTCDPDAPVTVAAQIMSDHNCGAVPIVSDGKLMGILTDRDIVLRVVAKGMDVNTVECGECMTGSVITASPEMDAHEAADLMAREQIRRLPVVENGRLVGIVALGDMARVHIHVDEAGQALSSISAPSPSESRVH